MKVKSHKLEVRIYYEDTDSGGVVYHANYLKYCERGRTEFMRQFGFEQDKLLQQNIVFAVRKANIDFIKPAIFNDLIVVNTEIKLLKNVSITFKQTIKRDDTILCVVDVVVACLKADEFKPTPLPPFMKSQLSHE